MVESDIDTYCQPLVSACEQAHGKHTQKTDQPNRQTPAPPKAGKNRGHDKGKGKKRIQASPGVHAVGGCALSLSSCRFFLVIR